MAKNIIYKPGQHLPAPVPANTKSGTAVRIGGLNAITITDRAKTDVAPISADGTINTISDGSTTKTCTYSNGQLGGIA